MGNENSRVCGGGEAPIKPYRKQPDIAQKVDEYNNLKAAIAQKQRAFDGGKKNNVAPEELQRLQREHNQAVQAFEVILQEDVFAFIHRKYIEVEELQQRYSTQRLELEEHIARINQEHELQDGQARTQLEQMKRDIAALSQQLSDAREESERWATVALQKEQEVRSTTQKKQQEIDTLKKDLAEKEQKLLETTLFSARIERLLEEKEGLLRQRDQAIDDLKKTSEEEVSTSRQLLADARAAAEQEIATLSATINMYKENMATLEEEVQTNKLMRMDTETNLSNRIRTTEEELDLYKSRAKQAEEKASNVLDKVLNLQAEFREKEMKQQEQIQSKMKVALVPHYLRRNSEVVANSKAPAIQRSPSFGAKMNEYEVMTVPGYASKIPIILETIKDYLELHNAFEVEGIFRRTASEAIKQEARRQVAERTLRDFDDPDKQSELILAMASLIGEWYRSLPTPLLSPITFTSAIQDMNSDDAVNYVKKKIKEPDFSLLMWLLDLCVIVGQKQGVSKMTDTNMLTIFAGNIVNFDPKRDVKEQVSMSIFLLQRVLEYRIQNRLVLTSAQPSDRDLSISISSSSVNRRGSS